MAFALTNTDLYWEGLDLACYSNACSVGASAQELDVSTFCSGQWAELIAGMRRVEITSAGPTDMTPASATLTATASTWAEGVATITATGHALTPGRTVVLTGFTPAAWNASYRVLDTPTANTFRVRVDSDPGTSTVQGRVMVYAGLDEILGTAAIGDQGPWSAVPAGAGEGDIAFFTNATFMGFSPLQGSVGEVAMYDAKWTGSSPLVRGTVTAARTVTATGTGTAYQLGTVTASQRVWAAVHVLGSGGTTPSVTLKIQSASAQAFGTPNDRVTFTAATGRDGQVLSTPGSITDTWWRAQWTVTGTNPSFTIRVLTGIA